MKKKNIKLTSLLLCVIIALSSLSAVSCRMSLFPDLFSNEKSESSAATTPYSSKEIIASSPSGSSSDDTVPDVDEETPEASSEDSTPPSSPDDPPISAMPPESAIIPDTDIAEVIPPSPTNDASLAAAKGLRSAVSIFCTFTGVQGASAGSGVIYKLDTESGSAFIITNYHVVHNSSSHTYNRISDDISVFLFGLEYNDYAIPAQFVGGSSYYDIAILRVDNNEILKNAALSGSAKAITIANSDYVAAGQTAIAIGNPEAEGISVTLGIVSVDSEHITMTDVNGLGTVDMRVIRIDTAVNSGNSGGGLFNANGDLMGIVNAKIKSTDVENIGYAIPSNVARAIADNIIDHCYGTDCETVMRGLLGITITIGDVSTSYDPEIGMIVVKESIIVHEVSNGGLAEGILTVDDTIIDISINGKLVTITRQHHLIDAMLDVRVGDTVEMTILRDGVQKTVSTVITEDCLTAY